MDMSGAPTTKPDHADRLSVLFEAHSRAGSTASPGVSFQTLTTLWISFRRSS
jgi:hypothetical protein